VPGGGGATGTTVGVEEMILQVSADKTITYINGPMAKLLQVADRKRTYDLCVLAARDDLPAMGFHLEVLSAIVDTALSSDRESVVETVFPGLPAELLPRISGERPSTDPVLRFVATPVRGQIQVVVQDVTQVRWLESMFSRYVSPAVLEIMQTTASHDYMRAEKRELTLLFGDLRGFTAMCDGMDPEEVRETVNSFFTGMVGCVEAVGGTVDKFVGDEIMALFGAPLHDADHALHALMCALEMQRVHGEWIEGRTAAGKPAPLLGIGVATGEVVIGNVGTPSRMDYTALGSIVNLAARLCGGAAGGEILTIRKTHEHGKASAANKPRDQLPHMRFARKGDMEFKNIREPVEVIRVTAGS
jgi:class 3 adenylate cyclase